MKIDRLINNIYYKDFVNNLYSYRTTDAHFHFNKTKAVSEIADMIVLCSVAETNFFISDKSDIEDYLSSQETLNSFESAVVSYIHYRFLKKKAEEISKINGPTKMDLRVNDSLSQKLDTIGLPNYLQNRNIDLLIVRAKELLS